MFHDLVIKTNIYLFINLINYIYLKQIINIIKKNYFK